jgi:hypothetical protein
LQVREHDPVVGVEQRVQAGEAHHLCLGPARDRTEQARLAFGEFGVDLVPQRARFVIALEFARQFRVLDCDFEFADDRAKVY